MKLISAIHDESIVNIRHSIGHLPFCVILRVVVYCVLQFFVFGPLGKACGFMLE